ncbi:sigma-54-dependent transcriptional regulator [Zavarzinia compransoris]|uniref:Sigma-54-dependent Fis family transcriptional regulator n=1 Tax=Zavarzinia compransoris TaxID=1264899 RepID=A0A317EF33_9PROT|nr:sigma-54 dependent transcriptional regulator [Zavarzinia compransoris]PWR23785.1 sigma-54-dependent Fis family transcriptional regulator [Zavarzinia compransoris]TDP48017.1 two-component system nitrogen regulation response regulator NtrX [Zavarzinia compransoris]
MGREILVVDDEADIRDLVAGILQDEGYETRTAGNADEALAAIDARLPSLVILDIWLQGSRLDGLEILEAIKRAHPDIPVVMISGHGTIETAVGALKRGAYDFIEKPFKADRLLLLVQRAIESAQLKRENRALKARSNIEDEMIGRSAAMNTVRGLVEKAAPMGSRVMIMGPPGAGKEVVARQLHRMSRRADGPFAVVNAATMAPERMEAELFGVEASASADGMPRVGLFEQAHGGTLFLDEVADMPLETQAKILRVLVDQTFERVGGRNRVQVDVRVVSASARDLHAEIAIGRFREDLFHRLSVVPIRVPRLADRREDIPDLALHFIQRISTANGVPPRNISNEAMAVMQAYDWPGNVRQLRNVCERLLILANDDAEGAIGADMLPAEVGGAGPATLRADGGEVIMALPLREAREAFERDYLLAQVARFGNNISRTATFIGMERSALHRKLKSLGITINDRGQG